MAMPDIDLDSATLTDVPDGAPDTSGELTCEVCGTPLAYAGKGRKPKFCDAHKPSRTRSNSVAPRTSGTKQLVEDLLVPYAAVAAATSMLLPTVSAALIVRGEQTVGALVAIAKDHPAMLKALKRASSVAPVAEIAQTGVVVVVAAALDLGRIPPEHPLAVILGVSELHASVLAAHADSPDNAHAMAAAA